MQKQKKDAKQASFFANCLPTYFIVVGFVALRFFV